MIAVIVIISWYGCSGISSKKDNFNEHAQDTGRWTIERVNVWYGQHHWLAGANFNPSTAINQLETWQAETFDPTTIDRELGWAEQIGFNCMRVYLHHVAWEEDPIGFKKRMNTYLSIADKHRIQTLFVVFDDCWNAQYRAGVQPEPVPGVHNSGWVQDPGNLLFDENKNPKPEVTKLLEQYTKDIIGSFSDDDRILGWDLYNEPGNFGRENNSLFLLKNVFSWAREINPVQPLTAGLWNVKLTDLNKFQLEHSDVITYHNYNGPEQHEKAIDSLKSYNRPLICTEYMARLNNSHFENIMPILKKNNIGAINWGLVSGRSNTIFAWDTPVPNGVEPKVWFHDIFRSNGTPFDSSETNLIKHLTTEIE